MTTYNATIEDSSGNRPTEGDDVRVTRTVTDLSSGQTLTKGWLTVKLRESDADSNAKLQLEITTSDTSAGQITDDGTSATEGTVQFDIGGSDYDSIEPTVTYMYDIQVLTSDSKVSTLEKGTVRWERGVTGASS